MDEMSQMEAMSDEELMMQEQPTISDDEVINRFYQIRAAQVEEGMQYLDNWDNAWPEYIANTKGTEEVGRYQGSQESLRLEYIKLYRKVQRMQEDLQDYEKSMQE